MSAFALNAAAFGLQIAGTVCLLVDSLRTAIRLPKEGVTLGDASLIASPVFQWASVGGFGLLFAGFILQGLSLWCTRHTTTFVALTPSAGSGARQLKAAQKTHAIASFKDWTN